MYILLLCIHILATCKKEYPYAVQHTQPTIRELFSIAAGPGGVFYIHMNGGCLFTISPAPQTGYAITDHRIIVQPTNALKKLTTYVRTLGDAFEHITVTFEQPEHVHPSHGFGRPEQPFHPRLPSSYERVDPYSDFFQTEVVNRRPVKEVIVDLPEGTTTSEIENVIWDVPGPLFSNARVIKLNSDDLTIMLQNVRIEGPTSDGQIRIRGNVDVGIMDRRLVLLKHYVGELSSADKVIHVTKPTTVKMNNYFTENVPPLNTVPCQLITIELSASTDLSALEDAVQLTDRLHGEPHRAITLTFDNLDHEPVTLYGVHRDTDSGSPRILGSVEYTMEPDKLPAEHFHGTFSLEDGSIHCVVDRTFMFN